MSLSPPNTYYLCFARKRKKEPVLLTPSKPDLDAAFYARTAYFQSVFQAMECHLDAGGLTFYLTANLHELPSYGPDVVAVVQGDEPARIPAYLHKVRATFKCYGTRQARPRSLFAEASYQNLLAHLQYYRDAARRLPGRLHYGWHRHRRQGHLPPFYTIPLGYANQEALPIKPIEERKTDVFFAGSVTHKTYPAWSLKRWLRTPKDLSRTKMLASLEKARQNRPTLQVDLRLQPSFGRSIKASSASYSEAMMNAKICLVPRGASSETFRFFEAMRYGCVPIAETLPPHWFYEDAPALTITDWRELPDMLAALLDDPDLLRARHTATLAWWQDRCSEAALGRYFAEKLNALRHQT